VLELLELLVPVVVVLLAPCTELVAPTTMLDPCEPASPDVVAVSVALPPSAPVSP
jgi:hypothetical protein